MNERTITQAVRRSEGDSRVFSIAFFAAFAIALSIIEHMVPRPLPWMRIGLANAITLYAFTVFRPREVLVVILARVVATSLLIGTFLSVTFILSLSGALSSFLLMYLTYRYLKSVFSLVGISVIGALTSNSVQLLLINYAFIQSSISYYFLPFVLLFALAGGVVSGLFGKFLSENI
jgi:heptaprenyl diphosphate synthase